MRKKKWTKDDLVNATLQSTSIRQILHRIGLQEAGGNYVQVQKYLKYYKIDISHLKGKGWSKGLSGIGKVRISTENILRNYSTFQSFKLKRRLFKEGYKKEQCEECGWAVKSIDGRIPLELDHINGNSSDNQLDNLRILCPNCHSLKPTHRGRNIGKK